MSENTPEGGIVSYTYTANDLVATAANQRNITVTSAYNTRNLVTSVSYSDGTPTATFAYDAYGARTSMTDGEGQTTYAYNSYRQLQSETRTFTALIGKTYTLSYTYNLADQPKSVNYAMASGGTMMPDSQPPAPQQRNRAARPRTTSAILVNYSISGTVREAGTNAPMSGVTVTATRTDDPPNSPPPVQTNAQGQYLIEDVEEGLTFNVSASKSGYTFSPNPATVVVDDHKVVDFTGTSSAPPSGTLSASPNPIQVCDGSGQGVTTLSWTAAGSAFAVEIHKDAPNGPLVAGGGTSGSHTTGKTVTNGTVYYLQNVSGGLPLTAANTLATRTVNVTTTGCPPPITSFNKTVNYAYNSVGALSGVGTNLIGSDPNATTNVMNTLAYRGSGAIKSLNYGNGRRLQMGYNANRQQPTSMKVDMASIPSDKILDYAYEYYDANGKNNNRIRKITDNVDASYTTDYLYDDYDRLTNATAPAFSRYYFHDEWGNIKNFSGLTLNHATNASGAPATNRISTAVLGSTTYTHTYDAAGNMTSDGQQTFAYDGANRLKSVGAGAQNTYGYDGNGARVRVVANGGLPTFYIRSSVLGQVVFEVNQNMVLRAYVNAAGKVIAQQSRDGQFYWLHTNHLGSGTKITDSAGVVKTRSEFDPYGQPLLEWSSSGDTYLNTKKFTGYERDEATGLDYANARMYANGRGRFMQPDPKGLIRDKMNLPQSLNRYAYAGNDPINHLDPSGKDWFSFLNFFAQSECAFKGGDFGGFYFNDFGQLFISCRGRGGAVQQLTKQILEALGEWSPPTHKLAKITWSYTDIYSTRNGVTICGQEASFQVRVQGQLVKSQGRENSNVESISSDDPIVRSILGQSINRNSPQWGPESDLFYDYQGFRLIQSDIETLRKRLSSGQEVIVKAKTKIEITAPGNANAQFALEVSTEAWFKFDGDKPSCGAVVARPNNSGAKSFFFGND